MATQQDKLKVVKAMAAMAWSDGRIDEREAKALRALAKRMKLDAHGRSAVEGYLISRPSIQGLRFDDLDDKEREALLLVAVHFAYLDGFMAREERQVLAQFAERLGLSQEALARMEEEVRQHHIDRATKG